MNDYTNKCNINFQSKYAYINDGEEIHITDYINDYIDNNKKCDLKCIHGHELICANGEKIKPYFRHKNTCDTCNNPMTDWHAEWEGNFPNSEICFPKINTNQIKNRRADAVLECHNLVIEFQHSLITKDEVTNRKHDYSLHEKQIIWIIHGNNTIKVTNLKNAERMYLEFVKDRWKYQNFLCYENIFIDIDEKIYKIYPNEVKNHMIDVDKPYDKEYCL